MSDPVLFDLRGYRCPLPVLKTRVRLKKLLPGERAIVWTDDPLSAVDVPHFCSQNAQPLLAQERRPDGTLRFLIERGTALD